MTLTLLLDLDDTLLNTNIGEFIPAYFAALTESLQQWGTGFQFLYQNGGTAYKKPERAAV